MKFNVCVATYETVSQEVSELRRIDWETLVVDEAHRLKNNQSRCGPAYIVPGTKSYNPATGPASTLSVSSHGCFLCDL